MTLCSPNKIRRCRPLLGTFVEISASGLEDATLRRAVDGAFEVIARVQALMSIHDPASELSRLNREAALHPVQVSRETFTVLQRGIALSKASDGAFDFTMTPVLARWGLRDKSYLQLRTNDWRSVRLGPGRSVRFTEPIALDLGGIAKGFAVDAAIETLRKAEVESATVNAGGDLRVLGAQPVVVHVRHPASPLQAAHRITLTDAALATSSPCFTERRWRGRVVSHLVNPRNQSAITGAISVTVRAKECWLADALTKVVLNSPETAASLLAKYQAEALVLTT